VISGLERVPAQEATSKPLTPVVTERARQLGGPLERLPTLRLTADDFAQPGPQEHQRVADAEPVANLLVDRQAAPELGGVRRIGGQADEAQP
jgi:hypothetical protein